MKSHMSGGNMVQERDCYCTGTILSPSSGAPSLFVFERILCVDVAWWWAVPHFQAED